MCLGSLPSSTEPRLDAGCPPWHLFEARWWHRQRVALRRTWGLRLKRYLSILQNSSRGKTTVCRWTPLAHTSIWSPVQWVTRKLRKACWPVASRCVCCGQLGLGLSQIPQENHRQWQGQTSQISVSHRLLSRVSLLLALHVCFQLSPVKVKPIGGHIIGHASHTRLYFRKGKARQIKKQFGTAQKLCSKCANGRSE